jgi:hypothetical protein
MNDRMRGPRKPRSPSSSEASLTAITIAETNAIVAGRKALVDSIFLQVTLASCGSQGIVKNHR